MKRFCILVILATTCARQPIFAAREGQLDFVKHTDLPDLGISLRIMSEAIGVPIPPPSAYPYRYRDGKKTWTEERFVLEDLWRRREHAVTWRDKHMNTLTFARISYPYPQKVASTHVTLELFEKALPEKPRTEWTPKELEHWVAGFLGVARVTANTPAHPSRQLKDLLEFSIPSAKPAREQAYALRLNRSRSGQYMASDQWFFLFVTIAPNVEMERAVRNIQQKLLPSITTTRMGSARQTKNTNRFQNTKMDPIEQGNASISLSREQARDSIRNMTGWWSAETPNYIFLSNLRSRFKTMIRDLQENVESLRTIYEHLIPAKTTITNVSTIKVFESPEEYATYVPPNYRWTFGLWMPEKQELVVRRVEWGGSNDQRKLLERTVFHEAFHQYLYYAFDRASASAWYNEGHAVFFENARITRSGVTIEEDSLRLPLLEQAIRAGLVNLAPILQSSYEQFYSSENPEQRQLNYVLAWAMIYYLRKGVPLETESPHKSLLARYAEIFRSTQDPDKATSAAFPPASLAQFEKDFLAFWKSTRQRANARRNRLFRNP